MDFSTPSNENGLAPEIADILYFPHIP